MKIRKRDLYICISITGVIGIGVALFLLLWADHQPLPDSYIYGALAFFTTEIFHCARIAINDKKKESEDVE
jgi:hypothetical protein